MPRKPRPWYRRQTGWWMTQLDGKKVKLHEGKNCDTDRRLAAQKLEALLRVRAANPEPESDAHTVTSVIDLYLGHAQRHCSARSFEERRRYLQLFAEDHGWRKADDRGCLPFHLESWVDAHPDWKSEWTRAHVVAIVQRPFNWAAKHRLIPANPFRGFTLRPGEPRRPMTSEEFRRLLRATSAWPKRTRYKKPRPSDLKRRARPSAGARFRQLLIFLRYTGARPGEASRLAWSDIDLDKQVIVLRRHKTSKTQRAKRPRVIPLHPVVLKLLIAIRGREDPGPHVFLTHRKTPWNRSNLSLRVRRLRSLAGVPDDAKLYGLRHAFGTRGILNGVDLKTLAELMGHTTTRMTEHYLHLAGQQQHLADAMRRANGRSQGV
jgi:integrase